MSIEFNLSENSHPFKMIEVRANSPHTHHRYLRLGFSPSMGYAYHFENLFMTGDDRDRWEKFKERVLTIPMEEAEEIAQRIEEQFHIHVVVKSKEESFEFYGQKSHYIVPQYIEIREIEDARGIIAFVQQQGLISVDDRAALHPFLRTIEDQLENSKIIVTELTAAQKDVIELVAEPYIDAIIQACDGIEKEEDFLADFLALEEPFSKRDIAFGILTSKEGSNLFYERLNPLKESCMDSYLALLKTYGGNELENTLKKYGLGIPSLSQQRAVIYDLIQKKLTEKFGRENTTPLFHENMRRKLFIEGFDLQVISLGTRNEEDQKLPLLIRPFQTTVDAIEGNLDESDRYFDTYNDYYDRTSGEEFDTRLQELKEEALIATEADAITIASASIDPIIAACNAIETKEDFLAEFFDIAEPFSKRDVAFAILTSMADSATTLLERFPGLLESCEGPYDALQRALKDGPRNEIFELIEQKLNEAFGKENNPSSRKYNPNRLQLMRKKLFAEGFDLHAVYISSREEGQEKALMTIDPFKQTIEALDGTLDDFHKTFYTKDGVVEGDAYEAKFAELRRQTRI